MLDRDLSPAEVEELTLIALDYRRASGELSREDLASKILEAAEQGKSEELLMVMLGVLEAELQRLSGRSVFQRGYYDHL